ncbi:MAG: hypothetical protein J5965_00095, partial [Aeriscardovia sp.]|nr:hypothetical protein [Aeriscardovia sp.]
MKTLKIATALILSTLTLSSCSSDDGETAQQAVSTPGEISLTRVEKKMVADGNDFAFSLLHQ